MKWWVLDIGCGILERYKTDYTRYELYTEMMLE